MRILHLCLSNYYIDAMLYQENMLVREHVRQGHEVLVIASTENLSPGGKLFYMAAGAYAGGDGARVVRLDYSPLVPKFLRRKFRAYQGLIEAIAAFNPDRVLFHGLASFDLLRVARYFRGRPQVRLFADTHTDGFNSARSFASKWLLHRGFYRAIIQRSLARIEKVLCVSLSTMEFAETVYGIPKNQLEFYPLGGDIPDEAKRQSLRSSTRGDLGLGEDEILVVQSGKFDPAKRLEQSLNALAGSPDVKVRLVLCGSLPVEAEQQTRALIAHDPRVSFLGWKSSSELQALLCAADIYLQPGSQSATMQQAICCGCAVVLDDIPSHKPYVHGNGWLIDGASDFTWLFSEIAQSKPALAAMGAQSRALAVQLLDYRTLAARII